MANLTQKFVLDVEPPDVQEQVIVFDDEIRGFGVRVTRSGSKSFILQARAKSGRAGCGRMVRTTLGRFGAHAPDLSVSQARILAHEMRAKLDRGEDPIRKRRQAQAEDKAEWSIKRLCEEFLERYAKEHRRSWRRDHQCIYRDLARWFPLRLTELTPDDVARAHEEWTKRRGKGAADNSIGLLRTMYSRALKWGVFRGISPTIGVTFHGSSERKRIYNDDEIARLKQAIDQEPSEYWRGYFNILMELGTRKSELLNATWENVDLVAGVIRFPAEMTKTGNGHDLPLTNRAVSILSALPSRHYSKWVFPSRRTTGPLRESYPCWLRICRRAGVRDGHVHDIRRTVATRLVMQGASALLLKRILNHTRSSYVTDRYVQLATEHLRGSLQANSDSLAGVGK